MAKSVFHATMMGKKRYFIRTMMAKSVFRTITMTKSVFHPTMMTKCVFRTTMMAGTVSSWIPGNYWGTAMIAGTQSINRWAQDIFHLHATKTFFSYWRLVQHLTPRTIWRPVSDKRASPSRKNDTSDGSRPNVHTTYIDRWSMTLFSHLIVWQTRMPWHLDILVAAVRIYYYYYISIHCSPIISRPHVGGSCQVSVTSPPHDLLIVPTSILRPIILFI